jgi:DNA-binding transcriptional ArsR family regulator
MAEEQNILEKIYGELVNVRHLLEIAIRNELKKEIEKTVTTDERRKIYVLLDGFSSTEEISKKAGVSQRAVQLLVKELADAGFVIMERRGYPKRVFDYIPSGWRVSDVPERK